MANLPVERAKHKAQNDSHQGPDVVVLWSAPVGDIELLQYCLHSDQFLERHMTGARGAAEEPESTYCVTKALHHIRMLLAND